MVKSDKTLIKFHFGLNSSKNTAVPTTLETVRANLRIASKWHISKPSRKLGRRLKMKI